MTSLAAALVGELDDAALAALADRLAPLLATRAAPADDGWLRGADKIAAYIDAPRSRVYALTSAKRLPCHRDGSSLLARKSELDRWLLAGGATRP